MQALQTYPVSCRPVSIGVATGIIRRSLAQSFTKVSWHFGSAVNVLHGNQLAPSRASTSANGFAVTAVATMPEIGRGVTDGKRRLLRDHRTNMRIMDGIIDEHGLSPELEERLVDETGNTNFFLGEDTDLDEDSDQEDQEAIARQRVKDLLQESKDKQAFVAAAQDTLVCRAVATDLERTRMQLEDLRAQMSR